MPSVWNLSPVLYFSQRTDLLFILELWYRRLQWLMCKVWLFNLLHFFFQVVLYIPQTWPLNSRVLWNLIFLHSLQQCHARMAFFWVAQKGCLWKKNLEKSDINSWTKEKPVFPKKKKKPVLRERFDKFQLNVVMFARSMNTNDSLYRNG